LQESAVRRAKCRLGMYGSLHISESVARLSVAGVVLWLSLAAGLATVVGVAAWTLGHDAGARYSPAEVARLQTGAYTRGLALGAERGGRGAVGRRRLAQVRHRSYERGYAAGYRAGRSATP
jgi:hypothetical protein